MNVLSRSQLPLELLAVDVDVSLLSFICALGVREASLVHLSKPFSTIGPQGALLSWDSCSDKIISPISRKRNCAQGRLALSPSPTVTAQLMLRPHNPHPRAEARLPPPVTPPPTFLASLSGLKCQVSGCLQRNRRAADSNAVLFTT